MFKEIKESILKYFSVKTGKNCTVCPYCGAKTYTEDNKYDYYTHQEIFCLVCEERFVIISIVEIKGGYKTKTQKKENYKWIPK